MRRTASAIVLHGSWSPPRSGPEAIRPLLQSMVCTAFPRPRVKWPATHSYRPGVNRTGHPPIGVDGPRCDVALRPPALVFRVRSGPQRHMGTITHSGYAFGVQDKKRTGGVYVGSAL